MEIWKDIDGYEGIYEVSSLGRVRSHNRQGWRKEFLSGHENNLGYISINLRGKQFLLHRIVADAFLPKDTYRTEVNHKNGIRKDNRLSNLERCTHSENMAHSYKNLGRVPPMLGKPGPHKKPIKCLETGEVFGSSCEAARGTGLRRTGIRNAALGYIKTCGGKHWEYVNK